MESGGVGGEEEEVGVKKRMEMDRLHSDGYRQREHTPWEAKQLWFSDERGTIHHHTTTTMKKQEEKEAAVASATAAAAQDAWQQKHKGTAPYGGTALFRLAHPENASTSFLDTHARMNPPPVLPPPPLLSSSSHGNHRVNPPPTHFRDAANDWTSGTIRVQDDHDEEDAKKREIRRGGGGGLLASTNFLLRRYPATITTAPNSSTSSFSSSRPLSRERSFPLETVSYVDPRQDVSQAAGAATRPPSRSIPSSFAIPLTAVDCSDRHRRHNDFAVASSSSPARTMGDAEEEDHHHHDHHEKDEEEEVENIDVHSSSMCSSTASLLLLLRRYRQENDRLREQLAAAGARERYITQCVLEEHLFPSASTASSSASTSWTCPCAGTCVWHGHPPSHTNASRASSTAPIQWSNAEAQVRQTKPEENLRHEPPSRRSSKQKDVENEAAAKTVSPAKRHRKGRDHQRASSSSSSTTSSIVSSSASSSLSSCSSSFSTSSSSSASSLSVERQCWKVSSFLVKVCNALLHVCVVPHAALSETSKMGNTTSTTTIPTLLPSRTHSNGILPVKEEESPPSFSVQRRSSSTRNSSLTRREPPLLGSSCGGGLAALLWRIRVEEEDELQNEEEEKKKEKKEKPHETCRQPALYCAVECLEAAIQGSAGTGALDSDTKIIAGRSSAMEGNEEEDDEEEEDRHGSSPSVKRTTTPAIASSSPQKGRCGKDLTERHRRNNLNPYGAHQKAKAQKKKRKVWRSIFHELTYCEWIFVLLAKQLLEDVQHEREKKRTMRMPAKKETIKDHPHLEEEEEEEIRYDSGESNEMGRERYHEPTSEKEGDTDEEEREEVDDDEEEKNSSTTTLPNVEEKEVVSPEKQSTSSLSRSSSSSSTIFFSSSRRREGKSRRHRPSREERVAAVFDSSSLRGDWSAPTTRLEDEDCAVQ